MCNEIDFNVIFIVVSLQWNIVNTNEIFIVVIILLCYWTKTVLLYCDFIVFVGLIDRENKNT
jgi:hypothetical protein